MQRPLCLSLTALVLLDAALSCAAQKFIPKTIQFKGDPEYSDKELLAAAQLKLGTVMTSAEMNDHAKLLMDSGIFENLTYKFDGVDLIFTLIPAPLVYPVRLENLPLAPGPELDAKLHDRFPLYHGKVPSEGTLVDGVRGAFEELLAAQGIKATIIVVPSNDAGQQKASVMSFNIESPPVLVGDIRLDPSSPPLETGAQDILAKLSGSPYSATGSPSQISTYLGNFYHDKGNLEAIVNATPQGAPAITTGAIRVPFAVSVTPGPTYRLAGVKLDPSSLVTQADFDHQSNIHPGDVADGQHVTQNWEYIARQYHNKGYIKAAVHPTAAFDRSKNTVAFSVSVEPGPVYTMGTLKIENVSDELRTAMLAAWGMPAGAVFNEGAIRGYFATHDVHPALERVFATVNLSYVMHLNEDTHTVDLNLRLEKEALTPAILDFMHSPIFDSMFHLPLPILEKLARPVIVYVVLVILLRVFGKRELAQLNPFDLVVLLSLSNTVQNAIIGDDNSVTGGVIGAFGLLAINWLVVKALFRSRRLTRVLEGRTAILIRNGQIDLKAMNRESLTREELLSVVHRQGFEGFHQVRKCELEPNGTFYVEAFEPSADDKRHAELLARIDALSREVAGLRANAAPNLEG